MVWHSNLAQWQRGIDVYRAKSFRVKVSLLFLSLLIFNSVAFIATTQADTLRFTRRIDSEAGKLGGMILQEAYRRIGHEVKLVDLPGARAIIENTTKAFQDDMWGAYNAALQMLTDKLAEQNK
jgi:hypothetical protein